MITGTAGSSSLSVDDRSANALPDALASRRDTSTAVTLSVNCLGLLPAYLAADPEQLQAISQRIDSGKFAALLLSELSHGSNILRNDARAQRGTLDPEGNFVAVDEDQFRMSDDVQAALEQKTADPESAADTMIKLETQEAVHIASIRVQCKKSEIQRNLSVLLPEVLRQVTAQGATMVGQPLVRYYSTDEPFDLWKQMRV